MSFWGKSFTFDGVPSEQYDLRLFDPPDGESGVKESPAGSDVQIKQTWIYRRPKVFHFGNYQNTPLEFDLYAGSFDPMNGIDRSRIEKWLMGRGGYKKLQITQDDIQDVYYNVICTGASNAFVGNVQEGVKLHFICDSPWGYTFPRILTQTFTGNEIKNFNLTFYNDSDDYGYLKPIVSFTLNSIGNSFAITNLNDINSNGDPNIFSFTGITPGETITVDNDLKTIVSSTGLYRLDNFNKNWFRLIPGENVLNIISGIGTYTITYSLARKIGA